LGKRTFKKRVADQKPRDYTRLTQEFRVIAGEFTHLVFFTICKHDENVGYEGHEKAVEQK